MTPGPSRQPPREGSRRVAALCFALAAAVRIVLVAVFPTIHGGDASARLAHAETLILGYQLPLPQLFVIIARALSDDPALTRMVFCLWGGLLAAGMAALLAQVADARAALFGGLLFAFDPLLIHYSIVPYQEPVAYALVAWAFAFGASGRHRVGAATMAAACLCRYEVWLLLPAFIRVSSEPRIAALAALPPLAWVAWWQGLAPAGLYVLDIDARADRLSRLTYLGSKFLEYETGFVAAAALAGLGVSLHDRRRPILWFALVLTMAIGVVIVLGHEYPPGSGLMSERLIHLPVILALALASLALTRLAGQSRTTLALSLVLILGFAVRNVRFEVALLRAAASDPDLALARDAARALSSERSRADCVSVAAPPVDRGTLDAYVAKVGAAFGDVNRARALAAGFADASPDRDRIAAHLSAPPGTIRAEPGCPLLVIVDDAAAPPASSTLVAEVSAGRRRARIVRMPR